jgi:hypothetical protein
MSILTSLPKLATGAHGTRHRPDFPPVEIFTRFDLRTMRASIKERRQFDVSLAPALDGQRKLSGRKYSHHLHTALTTVAASVFSVLCKDIAAQAAGVMYG